MIVVLLLGVLLSACGGDGADSGRTDPPSDTASGVIDASGGEVRLPDGTAVALPENPGGGSARVTIRRPDDATLGSTGDVASNPVEVAFSEVTGALPDTYEISWPTPAHAPGSSFEAVLHGGPNVRTVLETSTVDAEFVKVSVPTPAAASAPAGINPQQDASQIVDLGEVISGLLVYPGGVVQEAVKLKRVRDGCRVDGDAWSLCYVAETSTGARYEALQDEVAAAYFVTAEGADGGAVELGKISAKLIVSDTSNVVLSGGLAATAGTVVAVASTLSTFATILEIAHNAHRLIFEMVECGDGNCPPRERVTVDVDQDGWAYEMDATWIAPDTCPDLLGAGYPCGWLSFDFFNVDDVLNYTTTYVWVRLSNERQLPHEEVLLFKWDQPVDDLYGPFEYDTEFCQAGSPGCGGTRVEVLGIAAVHDSWWRSLLGFKPTLVALHADLDGLSWGDEPTVTYPLDIDTTGNGRVTSSPPGIDCGSACTADFQQGTSVTLTPTPASGWTFDGWSGNAGCSGGTVTMTSARTCTATFTEVAPEPVPTPTIETFHGVTSQPAVDQPVTLAWTATAEGTDTFTCTLDPDPGRSGDEVTPPNCLGSHQATIDYPSPGTYTPSLTITGTRGGSDTATTTLTVQAPPGDGTPVAQLVVDPPQTIVGADLYLDASTSYDPDGGDIVRYDFETGDGRTQERTSSIWRLSYPEPGEYEACVTVSDEQGDQDEACQAVTIVEQTSGDLPNLVLDAIWLEGVRYDDVYDLPFTSMNMDADEELVIELQWSNEVGAAPMPDGGSFRIGVYLNEVREKSNTISRTGMGDFFARFDPNEIAPGTYTLSLRLDFENDIEESNESDNTVSFGLNVRPPPNEPPTADFDFTVDDLTVDFTDRSTDPNGSSDIASWTWDFGDGRVSSTRNPTVTYATAGTYDVTLAVVDQAGSSDSVTRSVTTTEPVGVSLAPATATLNTLETLRLNATVTGATDTSVTWDASCGVVPTTGNSVTFTAPDTPGICVVTATSVDDNRKSDSATVTVMEANEPPVANFTVAVEDLTVSFTDASSDPNGNDDIAAWAWAFGDGQTSTAQNPSHTYSEAGTYDVALTVTDQAGESDSSTHSVTSVEPIVVSISPTSIMLEAEESTTFEASVTGGTLQTVTWSSSCGSFDGSSNPVTYLAPSSFGECVVSATSVEDPRMSADAVVTVTEAPIIKAFTAAPNPSGVGDAVAFAWDFDFPLDESVRCDIVFGDGARSTVDPCTPGEHRVSHQFSEHGVYSAVLQLYVGDLYASRELVVAAQRAFSTEFVTTSAGRSHSVALDQDGNAWAWGEGTSGELGNGGFADSHVPVAVAMPPSTSFTHVDAGWHYTLAIDQNGDAWAWGEGTNGRLGNNASGDVGVPVAVRMPEESSFAQISAGDNHSYAVDQDGSAWAWGSGANGAMGNGDYSGSMVPRRVSMPLGTVFTTITAGALDSALALDVDGSVWAWGNGYRGKLGLGDGVGDVTTPERVLMPTSAAVAHVDAGPWHSVAVDVEGTAWAWGAGNHGQLGDGGLDDQPVPVEVLAPTGVRFQSVSAGMNHSLALDHEDGAWSWGHDGSGQLGRGVVAELENRPRPVMLPQGTPGVRLRSISAGLWFSLASDASGRGWAWGRELEGQLGNAGAIDNSSQEVIPLMVDMP